MARTPSREIVRLPVFIIFIASGAAGLFYQVVWTRLLTLVFGSTIFAVSAVLTAFMAGLGLGSFILSRVADRGIRSLRLYGFLEIAIGVYALLFPLLLGLIESGYVGIHRSLAPGFTMMTLVKFVMGVAVLLLPTVLMGGTLPLLSRYLVRTLRVATREIAYLYAINTAGATIGTFVAGFFLVPELGLRVTMLIAVALNLGVGGIALALARGEAPSLAGETAEKPSSDKRRPAGGGRSTPLQIRLALVTMFFSGLFALAYEVIWTRILLLYMGSTTYTFSTMLTTFLFGIAAGSYVVGLFASKIRRPFFLLALAEIGIGASIFLTVPLMWKASQVMESPGFAQMGWTSYNLSKFGLCFLVMVLPTLLMGATFPLATQVVLRSAGRVGRSVGDVYAVNTLGAIFGSIAAGMVLIPLLGMRLAFAVLSLGNLVLGASVLFWGETARRRRLWAVGGLVPAVVLVIVYAPMTKLLEKTVLERITASGRTIVFEGDGLEAHVAIDQHPLGYRQLWINGDVVARSTVSVSGHEMLGHLPMLFAEENDDVLVIALGTGISAGCVSLYDPETLDMVEISKLVIDNVHEFWFDNHNLADYPRVNFILDDGRNHVQITDRTYDVVAAEPLQPWKVGVANLYTKEYYEACRDLLNDGGVVVQWIPLYGPSIEDVRDLTKTFVDVFPQTSYWLFGFDVVLLGHAGPFVIDLPELERRMSARAISSDMADVNVTGAVDLINHLVMGPEELPKYLEGSRTMSDWYPFIEYDGPKHVHEGASINEIFIDYLGHRCDPARYVAAWPDSAADRRRRIASQTPAWRLTHEGVMAQQVQRLEESRAKLEQALEMAPWLGDTQFYLSRTYYMLSQRPFAMGTRDGYSRAYDYCSRGLELVPTSRSLLNRMALCAEQLSRPEEAVGYWQRLLDDLPPYAPARTAIESHLEDIR